MAVTTVGTSNLEEGWSARHSLINSVSLIRSNLNAANWVNDAAGWGKPGTIGRKDVKLARIKRLSTADPANSGDPTIPLAVHQAVHRFTRCMAV